MKKIVNRIAVVIGAAAVSVGLAAAVAAPAHADTPGYSIAMKDSSWGR
jgi:hypothetical protein